VNVSINPDLLGLDILLLTVLLVVRLTQPGGESRVSNITKPAGTWPAMYSAFSARIVLLLRYYRVEVRAAQTIRNRW
jgi:hypothetical protein